MRTVSALVLAVVLVAVAGGAVAQEAPKGPQAKPTDLFQQFRTLKDEGRLDLAAAYLQSFVDSNPTDQDFLDLERRFGSTVFQSLRNVPKWSDDPKTEKQARANIEEINKRARAATEKLLNNPARIAKFIRNLGASYEERVFAELELRKAGDFPVPLMVAELRNNPDPPLAAGIIGAVTKMEGPAMAGWIAALDGLPPDQQYGVLSAIAARPDVLSLLNFAQTNATPYLWKLAGDPTNAALQKFALGLLDKIYSGTAEKRAPEAELTNFARAFYDHKARYAATKTNPDGSPAEVPVWVWDAKENKLVKTLNVPVGQADEYYGLRYARWALDRKPDYEPAQSLILALAAERAIERGKFGELSKTDPAVYQLLADAPSTVLNDLLDRGLNEKRTSLILAALQVLGDRADRNAATPKPGPAPRTSLFVKALNYSDPRVQLAAANALLRSPVPIDPAVRGRVVEVLKRAAATDPGVPGSAKGQAILADPNKFRSDNVAALLRSLGYDVEVVTTGRDLWKRIARSSDFDLIVIDHHIVNPELTEVVSHLSADANATRRPTLVIASADTPAPPSLDTLLLRLALLIAATESEPTGMPDPYVPDIRTDPAKIAADRASIQTRRDNVFRSVAATRKDRLMRVLATIGLELTDAQKFYLNLRVEQITYAVLGAEYPLTTASSPETFQHLADIKKQLVAQPPVKDYIRRVGLTDLATRIERLELDVMRVPEVRARYEIMRDRIDVEDLGLNMPSTRDPAAEARTVRLLRGYPQVRIIPEPYIRQGLQQDILSAYQSAADAPRDPAEKRAAAKVAVGWLTKMATGEITGFDIKPAEADLRAALRVDELADLAIDAVSRFGTAEAQQDLLTLALTSGRPLPTRTKAADAVILHIQTNGKLIPKSLIDPLVGLANTEADGSLRAKFLILKGLLAPSPSYVNELKNFSPPLVPPPPPMPKVADPKPGDMPPKDPPPGKNGDEKK